MRNLKITLEYDGTRYAGWQAQKSKFPTVQETVEKVLRRILREKVKLIGSGRTDAGVHAEGQVANFKTDSKISIQKLQAALNALLPSDIAVIKAEEVFLDFHSRFCAKAKIYRYSILNRRFRSALLNNRVYFYSYPLDPRLMHRGSRSLLGKHNFKAFCASRSSIKDTVRTIKRISINGFASNTKNRIPRTETREPDLITIEIEADGFLYNMVRNIVGTLLEIGRGKFPVGSMKRILESKNRRLAGPAVPACGLALLKVKY